MAKQELGANEKIHGIGQPVSTIEIVLKGQVKMSIPGGGAPVILKVGSIIGAAEKPKESYRYNYEAVDAATIFSYPYADAADMEKVIHVNQKIAPLVASAQVKAAYRLYEYSKDVVAKGMARYEEILANYQKYPELCNALGRVPQEFSEVKELPQPDDSADIRKWQAGFLQSFYQHDEKLAKEFYPLGLDMCLGVIYTAMQFMWQVGESIRASKDYINDINDAAADFLNAYKDLAMKKKDMERTSDAVLTEGTVPEVENAPETIMGYAEMDGKFRESTKELMDSYVALKDRGSTEEDVRKLRRKITDAFYKVYEKAILRYLKEGGESVPLEVALFLKFGFFDERVVSEDDFKTLYRLHITYIADPREKIVTVPEWLRLVFRGEVMPSKNEFDLDYPAYLREQKQNGDIDEEEMEELMDDMEARVSFEVKNLVATGNRMTFGRISVFSPVFDSINQMMPLDRCYASQERVNEELGKLRSIDFECFYREYAYSDDELGIPTLTLHEECLPYVILMPNIGQRSVLWQEIEGKKRTTSARMLLPIFSLEDFSMAITRMCGEFRWEMCKTEQGVHWNDISDPSLTAEYADFLQYYRKNSGLNPEQKEKVKKSLQKAGNNYRKVFVADYVTYIIYEAAGSLRMTKPAREILYRYIPFPSEIGEKLTSNGQYAELVNRRKNKASQAAKTIENFVKKREHDGLEVPDVLYDEVEYLKR